MSKLTGRPDGPPKKTNSTRKRSAPIAAPNGNLLGVFVKKVSTEKKRQATSGKLQGLALA